MIERKNNRVDEWEEMTVSNGYVIGEGFSDFHFKGRPYKGSVSAPTFYVFKVHPGFPLVLVNNGESINVIPEGDLPSKNPDKQIRLPGQYANDRSAFDLATFVLGPRDFEAEGLWQKLGQTPVEELPTAASLLYVEHGMSVTRQTQRVSHVMPSAICNHLFYWLSRNHEIQNYDEDNHKWMKIGDAKFSVPKSRLLVGDTLDKLLENRFKERMMIKSLV